MIEQGAKLLEAVEELRAKPYNQCQHCGTPLLITMTVCLARLELEDYGHKCGYCSKCKKETSRYRDDTTGQERFGCKNGAASEEDK